MNYNFNKDNIVDTKTEILAILKQVKPTKDLEQVNDIVEGGFIDSFELMNLIASFQDTFGIEITVEDLTPDNFNSVDAMAAMVNRLKGNQ